MDANLRTNLGSGWRTRQAVILLVEDEAFVREVAAEVLRAAGYRVWVAANAHEAEKIYDEKHGNIDLLFSDMKLPGETGSALAKKLRQKNPGLQVLLATGYGELMSAYTGSDEYLAKPFSSAELLRRVEELLGQAEAIGSGVMGSQLSEGTSGGLGQSFRV